MTKEEFTKMKQELEAWVTHSCWTLTVPQLTLTDRALCVCSESIWPSSRRPSPCTRSSCVAWPLILSSGKTSTSTCSWSTTRTWVTLHTWVQTAVSSTPDVVRVRFSNMKIRSPIYRLSIQRNTKDIFVRLSCPFVPLWTRCWFSLTTIDEPGFLCHSALVCLCTFYLSSNTTASL